MSTLAKLLEYTYNNHKYVLCREVRGMIYFNSIPIYSYNIINTYPYDVNVLRRALYMNLGFYMKVPVDSMSQLYSK